MIKLLTFFDTINILMQTFFCYIVNISHAVNYVVWQLKYIVDFMVWIVLCNLFKDIENLNQYFFVPTNGTSIGISERAEISLLNTT